MHFIFAAAFVFVVALPLAAFEGEPIVPFGQANVPPEYHTWTPQGWAKTKPQDYLRPKVNVSDIFDDPNSELDIDEELEATSEGFADDIGSVWEEIEGIRQYFMANSEEGRILCNSEDLRMVDDKLFRAEWLIQKYDLEGYSQSTPGW